jgi:hypothetical protein
VDVLVFQHIACEPRCVRGRALPLGATNTMVELDEGGAIPGRFDPIVATVEKC